MPRKTANSKTVAILSLGGSQFAVASPTVAGKLLDLVSKLEPVQREYDSESGEVYYIPESRRYRNELEIKFNQSLEPRVRLLGLPAPIED